MLLLLTADTPGERIDPDAITEQETLASPTLLNTYPIIPTGITGTETLGAPAATFIIGDYDGTYGSGAYGVGAYSVLVYSPTTITDPQTIGTPGVAFTPVITVATINDPETVDAPTVSADWTLAPDPIHDTDVPGGPTITADYAQHPDSIGDPETLNGPTVTIALTITLDTGITDLETVATPDATIGIGGEPDTLADTETLDGPDAQFAPLPPFPDGITDAEALSAPSVRFYPSHIYPTGITDPQALGAPSKTFKAHYNGSYGSGAYGVGNYQAMVFFPDTITDFGTLDQPALSAPTPIPPDQILPLGITDGEEFAEPTLPRPGATNLLYGAGIYGDGIYVGPPPPKDNYAYGVGEYGYGIYFGVVKPKPKPPDYSDPFGDVMGPAKPPLHILGIGPWSPHVYWRGASNYGVAPGSRTPHPVMALPPTTSKSFTLRLGEGGEARVELSFPRGSAVILDEMDTDIWWRRREPRTQRTEMIGRFNCSHLNLSTSDTGVSCSAQFDDWQTVLGNRAVLKYLNPKADPPTSMWNKGTSVISIIAWALPTNTGLDLSEATGGNPTFIGNLVQPFDLPPGTTMSELFANLLTITDRHWEWWIDTPDDVTKPPKLRFIVGTRGADKGVTLFDVGRGPTPIASWIRNSSESDYANSLYYTGGTPSGQESSGGVVVQIDGQIIQFGQRDNVTGNSSVDGSRKDTLYQHANKVLAKLADRRPNYTINLRQGFWRGRSHIDIGDTVTVVLRLGKELLQDKYRVSEITVSVDDLGLEDVTLNLGRLPVSADPRSKRSPLIRVIGYLKNYVTPSGSMYPQPD